MLRRTLEFLHGGVSLTRRGWMFAAAAVVVLTAAYAGGRPELLYVATLLGVLPLCGWLLVRLRRPRLTVSRSFAPHPVQAGSGVSVALHVRNRGRRTTPALLWQDVLPWHPGATEEATLPALERAGARYDGRGNSLLLDYELTPPARGLVEVGPFLAGLDDPFGMASGVLVVGEPRQLAVTPAVAALPETAMSFPAGDGEARFVQHRAVGDEDDAMTREYRAGDTLRRVHWRATARHGELKVRQEEQRSLPVARIIVDTALTGYPDAEAGRSEAFEWVVRMLASVAVHLREHGFLVSLLELGQPQLTGLAPDRARSWAETDFLTALASLELTDPAAEEAMSSRAAGPVIALLGEPSPPTVHRLLRERRAGELAVAFTVRSVSALDLLERSLGKPAQATENAELLHEGGWLVVPVRADDDLAAAWQAVVVQTGRARDSA